jgi:hypothetical protein
LKTIKKQITFEKGEINALLTERVDSGLLEKSAKFIKNFYCTIFGTLKNRGGTKILNKLENVVEVNPNPSIDSLIGPNIDWYSGEGFISQPLENTTLMFHVTAADNGTIKKMTLENFNISNGLKANTSFAWDDVPGRAFFTLSNFTIAFKGAWINRVQIIFTIANKQADEIVPSAHAVVSSYDGTVTEVIVDEPGFWWDSESRISCVVQHSHIYRVMAWVDNVDDVNKPFKHSEYPDASISWVLHGQIADEIVPITHFIWSSPPFDYVRVALDEKGKFFVTCGYADLRDLRDACHSKTAHFNINCPEDEGYLRELYAGIGIWQNSTLTPVYIQDNLPSKTGLVGASVLNPMENSGYYNATYPITFEVQGGADPETVLPVVVMNAVNGRAVSMTIVSPGVIVDSDIPKMVITTPDPDTQYLTIAFDGIINDLLVKNVPFYLNGGTLQQTSFVIDSDPSKDYYIKFVTNYNQIYINRTTNKYMVNLLFVGKFGFTVFDTDFYTSIGGLPSLLVDNTGVYQSNLIYNSNGILLQFDYDVPPEYFELQGIRLEHRILPTFSWSIHYEDHIMHKREIGPSTGPNINQYYFHTLAYLDRVSIVNPGKNLPPNRTYDMKVTAGLLTYTRVLFYTDKKGVVYKTSIINNGYRYVDTGSWSTNNGRYNDWFPNPYYGGSPVVSNEVIPPGNYPRFNLTYIPSNFVSTIQVDCQFMGRITNSYEWESIQDFTLRGDFNQNGIAVIYNNMESLKHYQQFCINRIDNRGRNVVGQEYANQLDVSSLFVSDDFTSYVEGAKLIPFFFRDRYFIIMITLQAIICYENEVIIFISKFKTPLIADIQTLKEIKFSQWQNVLIFCHNSFPPQKLTFNFQNNSLQNNQDYIMNNIPYVVFGEKQLVNAPSTVLFTFNWDSQTLTSNVDYFNNTYFEKGPVGQYINTNTAGFYCRINRVVSARSVEISVIIPPYSKNVTQYYGNLVFEVNNEPVMSSTRGYPSCCLFYQQRLWFGGFRDKPAYLISSRVNDYNNFANNQNGSNESIQVEMLSSEYKSIIALCGNRGIQIFCQDSEYVCDDANLTPNGFYIKKVSNIGISKCIDPVIVIGTTIFIDKNNKSLNSFVYDESQANFTSQCITLFNGNMLDNPIALQVDYNSIDGDGNFIYILNQTGEIIVGNILLEGGVSAFTRWQFDNGVLQDILLIKNIIYFVFERDGILYLERYGKEFGGDGYSIQGVYEFEDYYIINGLSPYINNTILMYNDARTFNQMKYIEDDELKIYKSDLGNGVTLDSYIHCGFTISYELQANDINIEGMTNNIKKRIASVELVTTSNTTALIRFDNGIKENMIDVTPAKIGDEDYKYKQLSFGGWSYKPSFKLLAFIGDIEIKSLLQVVNYGESLN